MRYGYLTTFGASVLVLLLSSTASAGPWVLPARTLWVKLGFSHWSGDEEFAGIFDRDLSLQPPRDVGDRKPFDDSTGGEFTTSIAYVYAAYGIVDGLQASLYLPHQWLSFEDTSFVADTRGVGDPIFGLTYAPPLHEQNWGFAFGTQIKIPTSDLPAEFTVLPVSEGQYDLTVLSSIGWAGMPRISLSADLGYRIRFPFVDEEQGRDVKPGNAFIFATEIQGRVLEGLFLKTAVRGSLSDGREGRSGSGIISLESRRRIVEAWFSTYIQLFNLLGIDRSGDGLALDLSFVLPVAGQDYPVGNRFDVGVAWQQTF